MTHQTYPSLNQPVAGGGNELALIAMLPPELLGSIVLDTTSTAICYAHPSPLERIGEKPHSLLLLSGLLFGSLEVRTTPSPHDMIKQTRYPLSPLQNDVFR